MARAFFTFLPLYPFTFLPLSDIEVDVLEPLLHVEAGAGLADPGEVAVTDDLGIGVVGAEALQQLYHGALLGRRAGVGGIAVLVEAALVADADGAGVVVLGVGTYHLFGTAGIDLPVLGDVVVVTDGAEATCLVARLKVCDREVVSDTSGGTVNYD